MGGPATGSAGGRVRRLLSACLLPTYDPVMSGYV
jgi:hypothetical protein